MIASRTVSVPSASDGGVRFHTRVSITSRKNDLSFGRAETSTDIFE